MKHFFIIIFISISLLSCIGRDNCNNSLSIVGKYQNVYDKKAKNILIIKSDGTFEQVFEKDTNIKRNTGTWKFSQKSCYVKFDSLKVLHYLPKSVRKYERNLGIFRNNNILFVEGLSYEFDFFRIKD